MSGTGPSRGALSYEASLPPHEKTRTLSLRTSRASSYFHRMLRQELTACLSPQPTLGGSIVFFLLLTIVSFPIGAALFWQTRENAELVARYDNFGRLGEDEVMTNAQRLESVIDPGLNVTLTSQFRVEKKLESPVYVYYELRDYYQNHKRYVRSLSKQQLGGDDTSAAACAPYRFVPHSDSDQQTSDDEVIVPCGLIAHSYFNDTFELVSAMSGDAALDITMDVTGIATTWDRKYLYGDIPAEHFNDDVDTRGGATIKGNISDDEHFMVWMRIGSRPTVRKLYGVIRSDIPSGALLTFNIVNNYNTYDFDGQKRLILTTANWTGGRNEISGIVYFVVGTFSAIACILILFMDLKSVRKPGDLQALSWNRTQQ